MALFAFWNLENLFAPESFEDREPWIAKKFAKTLEGWSDDFFQQKLVQLARVLSVMGDGSGPDVLGVCEVENAFVLKQLSSRLKSATGREYRFVHADSAHDKRGIDTAFIYASNSFEVVPGSLFSHWVLRRTGTRDITQVTFKSRLTGNSVVALSNHWPSRMGGESESSAGFRSVAGETLAYWHERIREELGPKIPIIAMGDLNDAPWDASVKFNANATRELGDVERSLSARFFNASWQFLSTPCTDHRGRDRIVDGTLYYKGNGNVFDQILLNKSLCRGEAGFTADLATARVFTPSFMVSHESGQGPIRYGLPRRGDVASIDTEGYSDHFPVLIEVRET
ncbi:MAG: endonuclease/exonuclease/phosphatase family protein [Pseudomonadota bacterium]